jgi:ABC-type transport system involved in cytochrome c biogenesis ATPase subunit
VSEERQTLQSARFHNLTGLPNGEWQFATGVNVIVGENGLGKSHVLKTLYALIKVQTEAKELSKSALEKRYADKLVAVFRPDSLGRLVKRKRGRDRCEIALTMSEPSGNVTISFASNAKSQVEIEVVPSKTPQLFPVYFPTRELVTLYPWFLPLYENYYLEFEEIWRDTVSLLGNPTLKGPREKDVARFLEPLEQAMGGKVVVDAQNGRFYLNIVGEGRMEMPLVAEGLRKVAMLARLISTGTLLKQGFLFWDEPEANLNPKLVAVIAASIVAVAATGVQVFIATHSLFLLRELEMLLGQADHAQLSRRWFALAAHEDSVSLEQSDSIADIQTLVLLDEELKQSDRFLSFDYAKQGFGG